MLKKIQERGPSLATRFALLHIPYFIGINSRYVLFRIFQLTSLSANPFQGNSNSTEIKTNPVSLVVKGPEANVISIEGLTSPIDILLPQTESLQVCHNLEYNSSH